MAFGVLKETLVERKEKMKKLFILILSSWVFITSMNAQIHCGSVSFEPADAVPVNLQFISFSEYNSGITINGVATLRIRVEDKAIPDPDCRWFLTMEVNNNPAGGTAPSDWETLSQFGTGNAPEPTLDILEVRISNACATSPIDGSYTSFFNNHGDVQDIIADLLPRVNSGSCVQNVNGPGDYISNYSEYTFKVDIRVRPNLDFKPGIYQLNLRFHLEEQN